MLDEDDDLFDTQGPPEDIDDLDDEMRGLLGQLTPDTDYLTDRMVAEVAGVDGDVSPPMVLIDNPKASEPIAPSETPKTQEVRKLGVPLLVTTDAPPPPPPPQTEPPVVDVRKQFEQFDAVAEEVLQGTRHDRQETQDAINLCRGEIQKAIGGNDNPARMWVDNLTKALEIKATINLTAIKALEAKAKLLAATKAGIQVGIQNNLNANAATQVDPTLIELLNNNPLDSSGEDEF